MCDDFVWDPTLEDLRNRKIDTGTFSSKPLYHSLPAFMPGFERPRRHKSVHAPLELTTCRSQKEVR